MVDCKFLESGETLKEIRELIKKSDEIRIAVAYLKEEGYEKIKTEIENFLKKKKQLWLLVGIAPYYITDATPIAKLLKLQKKNAKIELRYHNSPGFHPKVCMFKIGKEMAVIIGSSNLTGGGLGDNIEANILLIGNERDEIIKSTRNFYDSIWNKYSLPLNEDVLKRYDKNKNIFHKQQIKHIKGTKEITAPPLPSKLQPVFPLDHVLININWSPHKFKRGCTPAERISEAQKACCHPYERRKCIKEWKEGCMSSYLFKEYEYYTSKKYIRKGVCAFFIAKNPNFNNDYTLVGFLCVESGLTEKARWTKKPFYYFLGHKQKSTLFDLNGEKAIKFDENFIEGLPSRPISFYNVPHNYTSQGWIGLQTWGHRKLSNEDAIFILEKYYERTHNKKVLEVIEELKNR